MIFKNVYARFKKYSLILLSTMIKIWALLFVIIQRNLPVKVYPIFLCSCYLPTTLFQSRWLKRFVMKRMLWACNERATADRVFTNTRGRNLKHIVMRKIRSSAERVRFPKVLYFDFREKECLTLISLFR